MMDDSCSDIIEQWRFSKDAINKMNQITDKTKIIERGGVLCGRMEQNGEMNEQNGEMHPKIYLVDECRGTMCSIEPDAFKACMELNYVPMGTFHTHPGKIVKTQPSIGDLGFQKTHWGLMCIGAPKAKEDRIICIKDKLLNREDEIDRNKKLDDTYKLEEKIKNLPFYATKKEREDYDNRFRDIFSDKYYYKFDPSKCME